MTNWELGILRDTFLQLPRQSSELNNWFLSISYLKKISSFLPCVSSLYVIKCAIVVGGNSTYCFICLYVQGRSRCEGLLRMVITGQFWVGARIYQTFWFGLCWLQERASSAPKIFCLLVHAVLERQWREKWQRRVSTCSNARGLYYFIMLNVAYKITSPTIDFPNRPVAGSGFRKKKFYPAC